MAGKRDNPEEIVSHMRGAFLIDGFYDYCGSPSYR